MENNENRCPVFKKCSGCQLQNLDYQSQLALKQKTVKTLLGRFCRINAIIGMDNPYHYRNKAQAVFRFDTKNKRIYSGIFQSVRNSIVPTESCLIEDELSHKIIASVLKICKKFRIPACDERGKGFIKHVSVRYAFATGEIMVTVVSAVQSFPQKDDFVKELLRLYPNITTIVQNVNPSSVPLTFGDKETVLYGEGYISDLLCGKTFRISPRSFYQVNPIQTEVLYGKAIEFAALTGKETVLDAYCGIGTVGICASDKVGNLIGVEINPDAIRDAKTNAVLNNLSNAEFCCADAGDFLCEAAGNGNYADVVFMDPVRAGCDMKFIKGLLTMLPKKIMYISCNPETLARDLRALSKAYEVKKIQPVDMFPMTKHIECVCLLTLK